MGRRSRPPVPRRHLPNSSAPKSTAGANTHIRVRCRLFTEPSPKGAALLLLPPKLRLQLPVGRFFVVRLDPLASFPTRFAGPRTSLLQCTAQKRGRLGVLRVSLQRR